MIKNCKKHGDTDFSLKRDGGFRCKKCAVESVQLRRDKLKTMAVEYKGGCCEICGYNKSIAALEFHHLNAADKEYSIGDKGYTRSWENIKNEIDKCILVCANCHREIHFEKEKCNYSILEEENKYNSNKEQFCNKCGKKLYSKSNTGMCLVCYSYSIRKVTRPTKEILSDEIKTNSFVYLGKKYGVSDNTIKNWCKQYDLPFEKIKRIKISNQ